MPALGNESLSACIQTAVVSETNRTACHSHGHRTGSQRWLELCTNTPGPGQGLPVPPGWVMHLFGSSANRSHRSRCLTLEMDVSTRIYRLGDCTAVIRLQTLLIVIGPSKGQRRSTMVRSISVPQPPPPGRCRAPPVSQGQASH